MIHQKTNKLNSRVFGFFLFGPRGFLGVFVATTRVTVDTDRWAIGRAMSLNSAGMGRAATGRCIVIASSDGRRVGGRGESRGTVASGTDMDRDSSVDAERGIVEGASDSILARGDSSRG